MAQLPIIDDKDKNYRKNSVISACNVDYRLKRSGPKYADISLVFVSIRFSEDNQIESCYDLGTKMILLLDNTHKDSFIEFPFYIS